MEELEDLYHRLAELDADIGSMMFGASEETVEVLMKYRVLIEEIRWSVKDDFRSSI